MPDRERLLRAVFYSPTAGSRAGRRRLLELEPSCPRDEWLRRFALRLKELQPLLSEIQCGDVAAAAFQSSNDLEPEDAATVFSEILDASVPLNDLNRGLLKPDP
jgi:hypothetical protein